MKRNIWLIAVVVIVSLVIINNSVYFYITKKMLDDNLNNELHVLANQIEFNVEQVREGSELFEEQIARELRLASIATKYALPNRLENVTNEQLDEIVKELDLSHLTVMKKTDNDIILEKSTQPQQIGKSTKNWYPWHQIFQQLYKLEPIDEQWLGESMPNFWSGPFEVSSTNYDQIYKWGYFYDGTTDYMIDPYVDYVRINEYNEVTGMNRLFDNLVAANNSLLDIIIVNPFTFPEQQFTVDNEGNLREHNVQRPVVYGKYDYTLETDEEDVKFAHLNQSSKTRISESEGLATYKLFIPVNMKASSNAMVDKNGKPVSSYVLVITANYTLIQDELWKNTKQILIITVVMTLIMVPLIIFIMRYFKNMREQAVQTAQDTYIDEINALFQSIRSQRHDFLNQVQTIHSLVKVKMYDELETYTEEITGEIHYINDFINIGNPTIAALIRSKISQAEGHHIKFEHDFKLSQLKTLAGKLLDINRILGNLIDNAFDEVMKYDEPFRYLHLYGREKDGALEIIITNYCEKAHEIVQRPLFRVGYTSKGDHHQGLGLTIISELLQSYKGEIKLLAPAENQIQFIVNIPL